MHPLGDGTDALRAVVDGVHAGHHRQQHLRRANVARRLLPANVLLACLKRHAQRWAARGVLRHADDAPREVARELAAGGKVGGMRTAESHRDPEALAATHRHVGAHLPRRGEQR